jgi:ATP-dependent RNA helicase DDX52/ROK1
METSKLSSALFAGTHFNRKRFAADFARFHQGPTPSPAAPSAPSPEKKRKRKSGKAKAKNKKKKKRAEAAAASSSGEARFRLACLVNLPLGHRSRR